MRKLSGIIMTIVLIISMGTTVMAAEQEQIVKPSNVVSIRENVSWEEAVQDIGFDVGKFNESKIATYSNMETMSSSGVHWETWGEMDYMIMDGMPGGIPIGYSVHKNGDVELNTYHYTRTYLGAILKKGDSDRWWGKGEVKATGSFCDDDVWANNIHYVKYGTTE